MTANFEPLANAEADIDPAVYDKYIGAKVILDNNANGGGNIAAQIEQFDGDLRARLDDSNFKLPGMDDFAFDDI